MTWYQTNEDRRNRRDPQGHVIRSGETISVADMTDDDIMANYNDLSWRASNDNIAPWEKGLLKELEKAVRRIVAEDAVKRLKEPPR